MKKISIITVMNTVNYGSALQTLATQSFWEKRGYQVEFIDYWRKDQILKERIKNVVFNKKVNIKQWLKKPLRDIVLIISLYANQKVFHRFLGNNIHMTSRKYMCLEELQEDCPDADIFCTGSDQMWNSGWNQGIEKSFFLEYAPADKKRIAFSTSIGKTTLDRNEAKEMIPLLKKYDFITVREQSAVELLKTYGIESQLMLDPTLMFGMDFWSNYIDGKMHHEPYLLVYQLHLKHENADFGQAVKEISIRRGLKVVRIAYDFAETKFGIKKYIPKVEEFLSLIYHADYIVTDSFHGTAFSINFNRPFVTVFPERFNTRMENILKLMNLENRKYDTECDVNQLIKNIDYSVANKKLDQFREQINKKFDDYLLI